MQVTWQRPASRFGLVSLYGLLALVALGVARFIPIAVWLQPWWGCPLRRHTGIPCMACGTTRAFDWVTHGRIGEAFALTPLGTTVVLSCALLAVWGLAVIAFRAPLPDVALAPREQRVARLGLVAAVLGNWAWMVATR